MKSRRSKQSRKITSIVMALLLLTGLMPGYTLLAAETKPSTQELQGHWAESDFLYWLDIGVVDRYADGTLRPNEAVTLGDFAVSLNRIMGYPAAVPPFSDVPSEYAEAIGALASVGAITGEAGSKIQPAEDITREQAMDILARMFALDLSGTPQFSDADAISADCAGAAAAMQAKGYLSGKPGNRFDPQGKLTRGEMCVLLSKTMAVNQENPIARPVAVPPPVPDKGGAPGADEFVLLYDTAAALYVDPTDWEGVSIALNSLQSDIELVGGQAPEIVTDAAKLSGMAVLVGTIGKSAVIDKLVGDGKIDVSNVTGQWESYLIEVVDEPLPGVDRALVIAGSDKRGTIYGIYKISESIGVSPWVWWADSAPVRQGKLTFAHDFRIEQGEPSVKYRGIFLNDESPSLSGWVSANFGGVNNANATKGYDHNFYQKVFELILRLKGNYLWPVMWNNAFNTDDPLNPVTADQYGIVMGTSHQEHMTCADKEWSWSDLGAWNYFTNKDNVYEFWKNGVTERQGFETILTLGMRGQGDSAILGPSATLGDNMNLLKGVIDDQRQIITDVYGAADAAPQMLALYKEVEEYYYGNDEFGSLEVPEDVTLLLCDDNFGNVRTLPTAETRDRSGGYGMYYHFDYRGGPISYEWINQTPLTKVWEQMTTAYDAGVDRVWIVNVGDLKPMEFPIDYFLNLAYDYEQWSPANKVEEFTREWAAREFGEDVADDAADVLNGYTKINGARKAEVVMPDASTFNLTAFDEAQTVLAEYEAVVAKAEDVYNRLPYYKQDTFYQLALYPARASMNVYKSSIYAAWSLYLADNGLPAANEYAALSEAAFEADQQDMKHYNKAVSNGKWNGIMAQNHVNYTVWDSPSTGIKQDYAPKTGGVVPDAGSELAVRVQYSDKILRGGTAELTAFSSLTRESRYIDIFNAKSFPFPFTVTTDADWLTLSAKEGVCVNQTRIELTADWSKVTANAKGTVTVSGAGGTVTVNVSADLFVKKIAFPDNTYVETQGYVSINPARFTASAAVEDAQWTAIDNLGREGDSVKVLPNGQYYTDAKDAPYVEYTFYIQTPGEYRLNAFITPSNNAKSALETPVTEQLRFAAQFDEGTLQTKSGLLSSSFSVNGALWNFGVMNNARVIAFDTATLEAGLHTLRVYAMDPGVVLQKLVVAPAAAKTVDIGNAPQTQHFMNAYFGPPESYYAGTENTGASAPALDPGILQYSGEDVTVTFVPGTGRFPTGWAHRIPAMATNGCKLTNAQIAAIPVPTKAGFTFVGWFMPNGAPLTDQIIFAKPETVTARFISDTAATYTYLPNGGSGQKVSKDFAVGETAVIADCTFLNSGKVFSHWNTKADGSGDSYRPGAKKAAEDSIDLYAIWADAAPNRKASSEKAGTGASNAFDGKDGTSWTALGTSDEWIEFTLKDTYVIDSICINEDGVNIQDYEVQFWNAASGQWEKAVSGTGIGPDRDILFYQAQFVTTNKLRVNISTALNPPSIKEIHVHPFTNWALSSNGGEITTLPEGGEGGGSEMIDGERLDYTKRWRISSPAGFTDPVTLMLAEKKSISVINIFSITSLWNSNPKDITRELKGITALGTIRNLSIEYTADGETWLPLPGGEIEENEFSLITVNLDAPLEMIGVRFIVPAQPNSEFSDSYIRVVEFEALEMWDTTGIILP